MRFSCSPWAAAARPSALAKSFAELNDVKQVSIRPGSRTVTSWSNHSLPSGSLDMTMAIEAFIAQCASGPVILYMHDIGGPIGMRIATAHPERIAGLIFQNFTIAVEGWNPERLRVYERLGGPETPENLAEIEQFATVERDMFLHKRGARLPEALNPDYWAIDAYAFSNPASRVFMSRLFMTLTTNIQQYPSWKSYLMDRQPKTLIVWGRNDPLFSPAAPEIVKQLVPAAELRYFDGGHFVLDEYAEAIAEAIIETFSQ